MPQEEVRFWNRLGMYVTRADAEEYISKSGGAGAVLDEDVEEFTPATSISPEALRVEIEEIFNKPFESGEMSNENLAILSAINMEQNRIPRIKELMAEGMSRDEAKQEFEKELGSLVRETLGLPTETEAEREYKKKYDEIHGEEE